MKIKTHLKNTGIAILMVFVMLFMTCCGLLPQNDPTSDDPSTYFFPGEEETHEGTWLTWPHKYSGKQSYYFGEAGIDAEVYVEMLEPIWIEMTKALHTGETVHIIAYNDAEQARISALLRENGVDLSKIDFVIMEADDVWIRDYGPIFTLKDGKELAIAKLSALTAVIW